MTNPRIKAVLREAHAESIQDQLNYKICLCEDIIKAKKVLWSFGQKQHDEFTKESTATALFDHLYDMDIEQLTLINNGYGKQINKCLTLKLQAQHCGLD